MMVDSTPVSGVSWKEKLLEGKGSKSYNGVTDADLEIKDGNILQSPINGILVIDFLERLRKFLVKDMETTVVIKLLGHNISYEVLHNHISSLWRPSEPFRLMDVKNDQIIHGGKEDSPKVMNNEVDLTAMRDAFGSWMVVECKSRCNQAGKQNHQPKFLEENLADFKFAALNLLNK
ncbi:hypothetical protein Godav_017605 [Gossypium davidsonii]|uniref:DUF4283 domain-containing protein n=1 Tax=Gossypium davidsonii TaxID=34287 RepID=A0A7J8QTY5_GOSDV|nr:hypothetical protein [Gossypium davidsonii]